MVQRYCSLKNGKLNETIEVSALWSIRSRALCSFQDGATKECPCFHCVSGRGSDEGSGGGGGGGGGEGGGEGGN